MILVDYIGHLVSTESEEELHKFADELGLRRGHYQDSGGLLKHPHYDLTTGRMIDKARRFGAEYVTPQDLIRRAWWRKDVTKNQKR